MKPKQKKEAGPFSQNDFNHESTWMNTDLLEPVSSSSRRLAKQAEGRSAQSRGAGWQSALSFAQSEMTPESRFLSLRLFGRRIAAPMRLCGGRFGNNWE